MCVFDLWAEHRASAGNEVVVPPVRGKGAADKLARVGLAGLLKAEWKEREDRVLTGRIVCPTSRRINNASLYLFVQHFTVKVCVSYSDSG